MVQGREPLPMVILVVVVVGLLVLYLKLLVIGAGTCAASDANIGCRRGGIFGTLCVAAGRLYSDARCADSNIGGGRDGIVGAVFET